MDFSSAYDRRIHRVATVMMLLAYVFFAFGNIAVEAIHRGIHRFSTGDTHHHDHHGHHHADHHHGALDLLLAVLAPPTDHAPTPTSALPKPALHLVDGWDWKLALPNWVPIPVVQFYTVLTYFHPQQVPSPPPQGLH
jgi:hypothetical protein